MGSPGNMEAIMAIGVGYVFMLTPAIIVFLVLRAQQNSLEKRLDALVQMSRISGEIVGVDEICQPLINLRGVGHLRTWGIIFVTTALGICVASFLGGGEPLLLTSVIIGALGLGMLLAERFSGRSGATEGTAAPNQAVS
ncbi:hypothetical protein OMB55_00012800 [gamma proteobacterium HIMB55]|nr:hypothetical protein OMB55_00012800 [gamma proteobacterium HIMB55]